VEELPEPALIAAAGLIGLLGPAGKSGGGFIGAALYSKRSMARKKQTFDVQKEVRKLARERVGVVPSSRPILPKLARKKPKHKKPLTADEDAPA
jgi:hypothetical protein